MRMPATKEEIAATFMELAFRYGYRRTAVEDVARALHISKKTIYEYFSSKEALLEYALELGAQGQRQRVESRLTEATALGRALEVVRIALADARAFFASRPHAEMVEPPELQAQVNERVYGPMVRELLERGVAAGEFEASDIDMTTRFVLAMGMESVRLIREDPTSHPEEATIQAIRRLITGEGAAPAPTGADAPALSKKRRRKSENE
jgi:TetR/AcrR family transcriptional regulator, cholesterol catabolism regulator